MNHLRAVGQPGLFDDACDSVQIPDANTDRSPIRNDVAGLGSQERPSSSTPIIAEDRWLTAIEEPKRRKTYQRGTLYLEPRKRGPSVWKYRYFETVDGNRKRRKAIVGTILDCPTKSEARLASDHLKMQANTESTKPNVTVRPAATAAGIIAEDCPRFGFHNLRHGLSTFLIERRTRSCGSATNASPVECRHDDALRAQQPQGKERPSPIHQAFPAERWRCSRCGRAARP